MNQVCLSKGIGAPVGSIIVGSKNFITKVLQKILGKGVGLIAAIFFFKD